MLRRWRQAQEAEKLFWDLTGIVDKETAEILKRYSEIFLEIKTQENSKILDVGCGPTVASRIIKGGEKIGVDPLISSLLRKNENRTRLGSFQFIKATGEKLSIKDSCFDFLVCRNVLDHVQFPEEVMKEMKRVSKDSTTLILGINVYSEFAMQLKKGVERLGIFGLKEKFHPHFFTERTIQKLCSKYFSIFSHRIVYDDKTRWARFRLPEEQEDKVSVPYFVLSSFSSWIFNFFWNVVRSLNGLKANYFMIEFVIVAHPT